MVEVRKGGGDGGVDIFLATYQTVQCANYKQEGSVLFQLFSTHVMMPVGEREGKGHGGRKKISGLKIRAKDRSC